MTVEEQQLNKTNADNKKQKIVNIITSVIDKVDKNQQVSLNTIMVQLRDLLLVIEEMRHEVGTLSPQEIKGKHIAGATDELDAIVDATSEATSTIMDCCEVIQDKAAEAGGDAANAINDEVMKVYEACSFQDVTGQRISKVVKTFRAIEEKIDHLVSVLGIKVKDYVEGEEGEDDREGDDRLLNGPQLPPDAISQDDIDKLLAELDAAG